ncbi:glycosyltransferase [Clostridiaceae bacterium M8S5]|nr:glycosyltransferase [Clostridiaceae bacterium M8S5]
MNPLVSIIIPVHNNEQHIVECLNSVLKQTYQNIEIIIVDSNSQDNTKNIIKGYTDDRIKIIELQEDLGLDKAFDEAFNKSTGSLISRVDPDDILIDNKVEEQVKYLNINTQKQMVSCLIICSSIDEKLLKPSKRIQNLQNAYKSWLEIEKAIISDFVPVLFPTMMFRRELYEKAKKVTNSDGFNNQVDLFLNFLKIASIEKINKKLYIYRRHKDAYHIKNDVESNKYQNKCLNNSGIKDFLNARKLRDNNRLSNIELTSVTDSSNLRVLLLVDSLDIGGTETHVLSLAKELARRNIHVVVGTTSGPLRYMFDKFGIKVVNIGTRGELSGKKLFGCIGEVKKIITNENINIVHSHLFSSMKIGAEVYKNYKIPHVITLHGLFYDDEILWTTCIDSSKIIAVSNPVRRMLVNRLGVAIDRKIAVITNGIDTSSYTPYSISDEKKENLGISRNSTIALYCGRLSYNKAIAAKVFVRSCYEVGKMYHDFQAIIIGDGFEKWNIFNEANGKNCNVGRELISMKGFKLNVSDYYNAADIVVGTGRVAIEAMACAKPVIALGDKGFTGLVSPQTKQAQIANYFGDHASPHGFSHDKIVKELKRLLNKPSLRHELGTWGRQWCEESFNIKSVVDETIELYKSTQ